MMRIPTFFEFQRQSMMLSRKFDKLNQLQQQINSGYKLLKDSDDPILARQIHSTENFMERLNSFQRNGQLAQIRFKLYEDTSSDMLKQANDVLLQIQTAQSDTVSNWDVFATKLEGSLQALLNAANGQDVDGQYIFAGTNSHYPAFVSSGGLYQYQGSQDPTRIEISLNADTIYNDSGLNVFDNIPLGNGFFTIKAATTNTGIAFTDEGKINPSSYVADDYQVNFVTNTAGHIALQVKDSSGAVIVPQASQEPPEYNPGTSGMDLSFNGITINLKGDAKIGDSFDIQHDQKDNVFNSISGIISTLKNRPTNQGQRTQLLNQASSSVAQIIKRFTQYQSKVGTLKGNAEGQIEAHGRVVSQQKILLSNLKEADLSQLFTNLSQQSLALQATQEGFLKVQNLLDILLKS